MTFFSPSPDLFPRTPEKRFAPCIRTLEQGIVLYGLIDFILNVLFLADLTGETDYKEKEGC